MKNIDIDNSVMGDFLDKTPNGETISSPGDLELENTFNQEGYVPEYVNQGNDVLESVIDSYSNETAVVSVELPKVLSANPTPIRDTRSGPAFEAALETYQKYGMPIRESDDAYILMQFMQDSILSMRDAERVAWRMTIDDSMANMHDLREDMSSIVKKQIDELDVIRAEVVAMRISATEGIFQALEVAQKGAELYREEITAAAETHFRVSLRGLIDAEVRVAITKGVDSEIQMLKKNIIEASNDIAKISTDFRAAVQSTPQRSAPAPGMNFESLSKNVKSLAASLPLGVKATAVALVVIVAIYLIRNF